MSHKGKFALTIIIVAPPDQVAEGDRIWKTHAQWMAETHFREGEKALLRYNLSKGPELSNPMDLSSEATGNTCFVLTEVYEAKAGVADHLQQTVESFKLLPDFLEWVGKCKSMTLVSGTQVAHSLW